MIKKPFEDLRKDQGHKKTSSIGFQDVFLKPRLFCKDEMLEKQAPDKVNPAKRNTDENHQNGDQDVK
jgi:hypothetical protein